MGRDGMSNNDGAPLSISALTSLCEQSKFFYATAVTSSPLISRGRLRSSFWLPPLKQAPDRRKRSVHQSLDTDACCWFASTSISQAADICSRTRAPHTRGSRLSVLYAASVKCMGSDSPKQFDPRPSEHQYFKLPGSLLDE